MACTKFDDGVVCGNYDIDIHNPEGSGTSHYYFKDGEYYTIPYRCLVPKGSRNLLVAGRCISSTHEAQASYRIMPICCCLGEAAGIARRLLRKLRRRCHGHRHTPLPGRTPRPPASHLTHSDRPILPRNDRYSSVLPEGSRARQLPICPAKTGWPFPRNDQPVLIRKPPTLQAEPRQNIPSNQ